jgi:hypothetical protein
VEQVSDPVADRAGNHQRRQRILVDVARQVFAGLPALLVGPRPGTPGEVLRGRRRPPGLLAEIDVIGALSLKLAMLELSLYTVPGVLSE